MKAILAIIPALLISGCVSNGGYKPASDKLPGLTVSFVNPEWNGKTIPSGQQCRMFGGKGGTPALKVDDIPAGANAIIIEYNDLSFGPLSNGGGHGTIGHWIKGPSATLAAVPGETASDLPANTFIERKALSSGQYASPGYLPPCSGGRGNTYAAVVKAVYKATREGEESQLLAQQKITLGSY